MIAWGNAQPLFPIVIHMLASGRIAAECRTQPDRWGCADASVVQAQWW